MGRHTCPREAEVLDLVIIGQWPAQAEPALVSHAATCPICADLVTATDAMAALAEDTRAVHMPDASMVWYRAAVDARREASRQAAAPMRLAQIAALGTIALLAWEFRAVLLAWVTAGWTLGATGLRDAWPSLDSLDAASSVWHWAAVEIGLGTALVLLACYLVTLVDRNIDIDRRKERRL